jgi:hypothetical protein
MACNAISGPRQIQIDRRGKVWVVTGTGNLVSLDPCSSRMTIHELPDAFRADPFGLAPDDDVIGYTASGNNKVGMLLPKSQSLVVPSTEPVCVTKTTICNFPATTAPTTCNSNTVCPIGKTVQAVVTKKGDDTYVEAKIDTEVDSNGVATNNPDRSLNPLGITPVRSKAQGTFFFTVGTNTFPSTATVDRVGFVRLPVREKTKFARDDDDENDGDTSDHNWHDWHRHADNDDDDDDGVDNNQDRHDAHERDSRENDTTNDDGVLAGGASKDYAMVTTPTSLAIVALTTATDPLAQIEISIFDSKGLLVGKSLPTPGVATVEILLPVPDTYTCRVRNYGTTSIVHAPNLFIREPWAP